MVGFASTVVIVNSQLNVAFPRPNSSKIYPRIVRRFRVNAQLEDQEFTFLSYPLH
jgi:hypothetical protein